MCMVFAACALCPATSEHGFCGGDSVVLAIYSDGGVFKAIDLAIVCGGGCALAKLGSVALDNDVLDGVGGGIEFYVGAGVGLGVGFGFGGVGGEGEQGGEGEAEG